MTRTAKPFRMALLLLLCASVAHAAPVSFSVDPMMKEVPATPGTPLSGVITVTADGQGDPIRLRVYAQDWTLDRLGTPQFAPPGTTPASCSAWLRVNPVELTVQPGQSQIVRYTLSVPPGASGTLHTILMFETAPTPLQAADRAVRVNGRIGSALYVQIGPQVRRARITGFSVTPQNTTLTVQNTGNSHVRLKGTLQWRDGDGQLVLQTPLPGAVLLPGASGVRDLRVPTPTLGGGLYAVTALLDYGGDVLAGARTHAHLP